MTEAEDLYSKRGQLLETIASASDEIKAIECSTRVSAFY